MGDFDNSKERRHMRETREFLWVRDDRQGHTGVPYTPQTAEREGYTPTETRHPHYPVRLWVR